LHIGEVIVDQSILGCTFVADQANDNICRIGGEVLKPGVAQPSTGARDEIGGHDAGLDEQWTSAADSFLYYFELLDVLFFGIHSSEKSLIAI
jgi:hypothetical protein